MILGWPLPKVCLVIPTSNQDGRQAKNRKKGKNMAHVHDKQRIKIGNKTWPMYMINKE
jgi:hypothetical protein